MTRVRLLGTGTADGWPNPFCDCGSCRAAAVEPRAQSATLVDDALLIDCGPEAPRSAVRQQVSLRPVRWMLFTHAHPDHLGPAALLWRHWTGTDAPLEVLGPPAVLAACEHWIGPRDPVRLRVLHAGERVRCGPYLVEALEATHDPSSGPPLLYAVTVARRRLLYATDTGPLPEPTLDALGDRRLDLVLLECTGHTEGGHHDLDTVADTLAALRARGAVDARSTVVAIHAGHHNPAPDELRRRLGELGAQLGDDGQVIELDDAGGDRISGSTA
ncbi:MAG TPA: MBL fold metallo-hydrolase [Mycobacteriales bacterium]|nr:MBL fold metallo-hydrolase [Mycobacteriales bacterium]